MRAVLATALALPVLALAAPASAGCMEEIKGICVYDVRDDICPVIGIRIC